ncbi:MAG: ABC transporter substrate-binding protein [Thermomicrobiales bacterium]
MMSRHQITRRGVIQIGAAASLGLASTRYRFALAGNPKLVFWNPGIFPTEDPNDKTKAVDDFYIYQAGKRFGEANGCEVSIENAPNDPGMFGKYRTASIAKNGPDAMVMWSGSYMLSVKDFLEPLGSSFTPEERARITGWEAVTPDFTADSPNIFGVPAASDGTTCIFYNKEMFAKAGVDTEAGWPKNATEFFAALDAIKATGVTPITLDNVGFVWQSLCYWMSQQINGAPGVNELVLGKRNFTDPELVAAAAGWMNLAQYTVPGAESMDGGQAYQYLFQKQAAMTTAGSWLIKDGSEALGDNFGMIKIPNFIETAPIVNGGVGGPGTAFIVSNYSPNKELAIQFIKFLMSPEEQLKKAESGEGAILNVTDVDFDNYKSPLAAIQQQWANEPSTIFWNDNIYPADLTTELRAQAQLAWTGQLSAEEFMGKVNAKRDELLGA